jgi:hypothetical protein
VAQTDAETFYSSLDNDVACESQMECFIESDSIPMNTISSDVENRPISVGLPDLGPVVLNLSQGKASDIPSPDSDLTPMNDPHRNNVPVVALHSLDGDDTTRSHDDGNDDPLAVINIVASQETVSVIDAPNNLVQDKPEASIEGLGFVDRTSCPFFHDLLTNVSDPLVELSEDSRSSYPNDSEVEPVQQSSIDVSSPQFIEAKRVKKFRKKRKSSQNCQVVQGSSTSQDEHSDYVYVERPRPHHHKRSSTAVPELVEVSAIKTEVEKEELISPHQIKDSHIAHPESEMCEVPRSPSKDIVELNLSLEQDSFERLKCASAEAPISVERDSASEGQQERKMESDGSSSPAKITAHGIKNSELLSDPCCLKISEESCGRHQTTEESEFLSVLHGLKPIPKSQFYEVKRTVSPIKKRPSRQHMQSWARHLLTKSSSPDADSISLDNIDTAESPVNFVALNPVETVVTTPVESLLLCPSPALLGGTLSRPRLLSGSRTKNSLSNSSSDKGVEQSADDEIEGIYFSGKSAPSNVNKIHTTGLSSVLFDDTSALSDVDEDMEKFEEELCRENFKAVMNELVFAVQMFGDGSQTHTSPGSRPETKAEPSGPTPSTSNFLDLSFSGSTCEDVSRVQEAIHQQYYNQVVREIKEWSYNPECELDGDQLTARLRIQSEPSSSEGELPSDCISRGTTSAMCGSDTEICTPKKLPGLESHPCPDSPYQKAHSMSVLLKSREVRKLQSKLKTCRNPDCEACLRRRKRRSDRWKNWKILNQDGNPCETN